MEKYIFLFIYLINNSYVRNRSKKWIFVILWNIINIYIEIVVFELFSMEF